MKVIYPKLHAALDYATAVFLLVSPLLFTMDIPLAVYVYALAAMQLTLSILTDYDYALFRVIAFPTHGKIELGMAVYLGLGAVCFQHAGIDQGFVYCAALAGVYLVAVLLTRFRPLPRYNVAVIF